jgi:ERCC4-type nuclease
VGAEAIKEGRGPFTVVIDDRERKPYPFDSIREGLDLIAVPTLTRRIPTGDYVVDGLEGEIVVERKSLEDLYATLGQRRKEFEAEMIRMQSHRRAFVVVEAGWDVALLSPPIHSRLNPRTVSRTVIAWAVRYGVHFQFLPSRKAAEAFTYRLLERAWKEATAKTVA